MKQFKHLFMLILLITTGLSASAQTWSPVAWSSITATDEVIITMTTDNGSGTTYALPNNSGTSDAPTAIEISYSSGAVTITTPDYTIDNLSWNINTSTGKIYPNGSTETWLYTTNSNNGVRIGTNTTNGHVWSLDGNYLATNEGTNDRWLGVYLTNPDWRAYKNITGNTANQVVTFYKKGGTPSVATPTFTPAGGVYNATQYVSIGCSTTSATIRYTTDGNDPTESSNIFSTPIEVSSTTTIKAKAWKTGMNASSVASATYTFTSVINIAAARVLETGAIATVQGVVTFIDGRNVYIQDNTAAIDLYLNNNTVPETLAVGDMVQATGSLAAYKGLIELSGIDGSNSSVFSTISTGNALPLAEKTIAEILTDFSGSNMLQSSRVKIINGVLGAINTSGNTNLTQGENTTVIYKIPELTGISEGSHVNVTSIIGCYNTPQLRVRIADDVELLSSTIAVTPNALTGFYYGVGNGPSQAQSISVEGSILSSNITVAAQTNYELSLSETGTYTTSLNIAHVNGNVAATTVYVRLKAGLSSGSYSEEITVSSTGITSQIVNVSGSVTSDLTFNKLYNHSDVTATGTYMIVDVTSGRALTSANGATAAPSAVEVTIIGDSIKGFIADDLQWKFTSTTDGYIISPKGSTTTWLYTGNSNNGVRVGTDPNNVWTLNITDPGKPNYHGFLNNAFNRYLGVYNNSDWRTYTSIATNIQNSQIEIFVLGAAPIQEIVATPTFTPAGGIYSTTQNVSIGCSTTGATIRYTTDGSDPTESSNVFSTPIEVSSTTTIKAKAWKTGMSASSVASATYTFTSLINIAAARVLETGTIATVQGVVTFIDGRNVYIQDNTAAIDLYLNNNTVPETLAVGDMVQATGSLAAYKGLIELSGIDGSNSSVFSTISTGNTLPLAEKTIAEILTDFSGSNMLQSSRVKIINGVLGAINTSGNTNLTQGENTTVIYRIPELTGISEGSHVNVTSIIGCYNTPQLRVRMADDVELLSSTIAVTPNTLTGFYYGEGNGPSQAQSISVEGSILSSDITVAAQTNYELSLSETGTYTTSLNIAHVNGNVAATTVYVRLKAGLSSGSYSEEITVSSTGITSQIVNVSGSVAGILTFNKLFNHSDVTATGTYMIVDVTSGRALTSANGMDSAPSAVEVTIIGDSIKGFIADDLQWKFTSTTDGYIISPKGSTTTWLYTGNSNNGVRVGNDPNNVWTLNITDPSKPNYHGFLNNAFNRYLGVYNNSNWRTYTTIATNIQNSQIEIFVLGAAPIPGSVATPTFTPAEGSYLAPQDVAINCETEGSIIYYTTNGDTPTISSSVYSTPIAVSNTMTIKALAVKSGLLNSQVASATYTFATPITIAEARALANNTSATVEGVVTFIDGRNVYVQDNTAAIDLYLNNGTVPETLAVGDMVRATGNKVVYNGLTELSSINGASESAFYIVSNGNALPLAIKTIAEINTDFSGDNLLQSTRVKIVEAIVGAINNNGNTPIAQGNNSMNIYRLPAVEGLIQGDWVTVTGIIGCYNNPQLRVSSADDVQFTHRPTITVTPNSLAGFTYIEGNGPSAIQSFTISGSTLQGSVNIYSSDNYEVSFLGGDNFYPENPATINASSGNFSNLNVYTRLKSGLTEGSYNESLMFVSTNADTVYLAVSGSVTVQGGSGGGGEYSRINSISDLTAGSRVIFAARFDGNSNDYYAMENTTTGKPTGVMFTSTTSGANEIIPTSITGSEDTYYWTVGIDGSNYTFTNAIGELIGYASGTNFTTGGDNTGWTVSFGTSDPASLVPSYNAFTVVNTNNSGRAFALNTSHNYGAYSTSNMTGSNAANYNFYIDLFVNDGGSGPATVATPTFSPAAGTYYEAQNVSISCATPDATIYYTTDGTDPDATSTVYSTPILVSNSMTIKAIAYKSEMNNSAIAEAEYDIQLGVTSIFNQNWEGDMNGWTFISVEGTAEWNIASYGNNHYAYANGYNAGANIDWCISPAFNIDNYSNVILSFLTAKNYNGPDLEVYFSNNYDGATPATATWTPITCTLSTGNWTWVPSGEISLSGFSGTNCYIGFKYTSTETEAAGWELDDCLLIGNTSNPTLTATPSSLNGFSYIVGNGPSAEQMLTINGLNLTNDVTVTAPTNYEISSASGSNFSAQASITMTISGGSINEAIYVRLKSGLAVGEYNNETITITSTGVSDVTVTCNGSVMEEGQDWHRIASLSELSNGSKIIVASRYSASATDSYYVMPAETHDKPIGVLCTTTMSNNHEILPAEIANNADTYYWNVTVNDTLYIFTNANGDTIGYSGSGTNFATGANNSLWDMDLATAGDVAMVPNYTGFTIINANYGRGFALNTSFKFGAYSTTNLNSADYNFYQDIFMEGAGGTPTVAAPYFSPAAGTYYEAIDVTIACATEGATIYYTTDGTDPDSTSSVYSTAISVDEDMTIKAIAYKAEMNHSNISTASYIIRDDLVIIFNQDWENDWNGWTEVSNDTASCHWNIASYNNNMYAYVNGYNQGPNEDWLLSPAFNLNEYAGSNVILTFKNAKNYTGPDVELLFSNDYDGVNPTTATWLPMTYTMSQGSWSWAESGEISLNEYSGTNCYIAYKYTCTETEAAAWEIDDIMLVASNDSNPYITATPSTLNGFSYLEGEGPSQSQTYTLSAANLVGSGNITVTSAENYEISLDDTDFADTQSIAFADGNITGQPVTVYVRMKADLALGIYEGIITNEGGEASAEVSVSGEVTSPYQPGIVEEIVPQYIEGINGTNNNRVPYAFRLTFGNLLPNATYRYTNQAITTDDGATATGAGNIIYVNGDNFVRTTSPSLETEGGYGVFTTDANGSYSGWFITEPTANTRFTPGNQVYMRVRINDGNEGTTAAAYYTTTNYATVLSFGTENDATMGTAIWGISEAQPKDFVLIYDNTSAEGRPIYGTSIEATGIDYANINQYATFYKDNIAGVNGSWGGIVPNVNDNGIKYIGIYGLTDGALVNSYTSQDGTWGTTNTVNPNTGIDEPLLIDLISLNINETEAMNVKVWNTKHEIVIENNSNSELQINVFNILGQPVLYQENIGQGTQRISHNLPLGAYIIRLGNNVQIETTKFIVK